MLGKFECEDIAAADMFRRVMRDWLAKNTVYPGLLTSACLKVRTVVESKRLQTAQMQLSELCAKLSVAQQHGSESSAEEHISSLRLEAVQRLCQQITDDGPIELDDATTEVLQALLQLAK
jgi:hypothetical protein